MKYAVIVLLLFMLIGCSGPTENITALKETAYNQGYDVGYSKGYIMGVEDTRASIEDTKSNAYKEGYIQSLKDGGNNQVQIVLPPSSYPHKYLGSTRLKTFHWPNCPIAIHIPFESKYWFDSCSDAVAASFHPCDTCKPCN